jgi:hypothetical protein
MHNAKDIQIILSDGKMPCTETANDPNGQPMCGTGAYKDLLTNAQFGAVVRGDTYYSYRFLEVMSAGAIPVILSDMWALPFHEVLDYPTFAVLAKEHELDTLEAELRAIPAEKVCAMRKAAFNVYTKHFATFDAQVETAMQIFEARKKGTARKPPLDWRAICDEDGNGGRGWHGVKGHYQCDF